MDFGFSDEQREFRALCRRFAAEVIRPVAAKHDAEESTPWEVIEAAREWGLHGIEHLQRMANDPDGQFSVIYAEELHWGCAGIALAISGSALAAAGLAASGHSRADRQMGSRVLRVGRRGQARRLRRHRAAGRLRRQEPPHHGEARRRRVGAQRHQGLHHQRRHRRRPRGRRHRGPGSGPPRPGLVRDPQGHAGPQAGQEGVEARHPSLSHRRGDPRGLPRPGREPARRHGEARAQARARPLGRVQRPRLQRARHLRADAAGRRRLGARDRPGRVRVDAVLPRQRWLGGPGRRVPRRELHRGPAAARAPGDPAAPGRRGHGDRGGAPAGPARVVDGSQRHPDDRRPGLDVEAEGRRRRDVGDPHLHGPGRPVSRRPRTARWRSGSATRRSTSCSRARPRSSAW